jgi:hypothetical protein
MIRDDTAKLNLRKILIFILRATQNLDFKRNTKMKKTT